MLREEYYKNNPLIQVTFQIRFNTILELMTSVPALFQKKLGINYVYHEVRDVEFSSLGVGTSPVRYSFSSASGDIPHEVILCPDYLQVLTKNYKNFPQFLDHIQHAVKAFQDSYPEVNNIKRIGFMYQNIIIKEKLGIEDDWKDLLNKDLAPELFEGFPVSGLQSFTKIYQLKEGEYNFLCKNGLIEVVNQITQDKTHGYNIDIDGCLMEETSCAEIIRHVREIRTVNKRLFRCFITDKLHKLLQPTKD